MESSQRPAEENGQRFGALVFLGLPCALQVVAMYVLVAVETPLSPFVARLLERPIGIFVLAMIGFTFVCIVMWGVLTWAERRYKRTGAANQRSV